MSAINLSHFLIQSISSSFFVCVAAVAGKSVYATHIWMYDVRLRSIYAVVKLLLLFHRRFCCVCASDYVCRDSRVIFYSEPFFFSLFVQIKQFTSANLPATSWDAFVFDIVTTQWISATNRHSSDECCAFDCVVHFILASEFIYAFHFAVWFRSIFSISFFASWL